MPTYANTIDGNEILAKRSQCDYAGNDIQQTYATKSEVTTGLASKQDTISDLATIRSGAADGATAVQPGDLSAVAISGNYSDLSNTPTIPSGVELVPAATSADANKVLTVDGQGIPGWAVVPPVSTGLFEAVYGQTSYSDITQAISDKKIVYCRISATGASRMAFLAYIGTSNVEFQYYRSLSSHSASNMTDEVYVYTVASSGWTTTTRKTGVKVVAGTHMSQSYSNDTLTLNATWPTVDQIYDAASANAQSGVAVASAIAGVNAVPASTSADADKVLTVDAQGTPTWANAQAPISAGNGIDITNNVVSAKVDGTTITTNGSGELAVVNGGQSTASSFFTPAYGKSADGSLSAPRLGPSLHTRYYSFNSHGLALENSYVNSSISVLGRRPDVRLANFIQPNGNIIFMYGASTWNASWYPVWFPCNHRYDSAGYINVIDPTVYLKAKSPVTFTDQSTEGQYIYNSDGTYNTHFNTSNRYSFSVKAPLSTGYNVDTDTYDMIGDWTSITTPPLDEWVLTFWDGNNNTWKNIGGATEADSRLAVKWNTSSLDVKVMSGGGLDVNTGAGLYVTNPLPTSSSSDEGKVLTVNSSGSAEWGNASTVTVDQTYDGTSTNAQSGTAVAEAIATKEDAFDVGTGLEMDTSGATPTLQVEAPVDIVAGPGIVIDNPDGNTLRVSTDENYEKELYVNTTVPYTNVDDVFTLTEPVTNFERIRVETWNREFQQYQATYEFTIAGSTTSTVFVMSMDNSESTSNIQRLNMRFSYNSAGNLVDKGHVLFFGNGSSTANGPQRGLGIHRVVGIHRIQGGN